MAEHDENSSDSKGFLAGLAESFKSHLDERLRSPFAGAFVVSWLATNWKVIAILFASTKTIEERIADASQHLTAANVIWWPLLVAFCVTLFFYLGSLLFLILLEIYGSLRRRIERWFDNVAWKRPQEYVALKRKSRDRERELLEFASDNESKLNDEKNKVVALSQEIVNVRSEQTALTSQLQLKVVEASAAAEKINSQNQQIAQINALRIAKSSADSETAKAAIDLSFSLLPTLSLQRGALSRPRPISQILAALLTLQDRIFPIEPSSQTSMLGEHLTAENLAKYTRTKYPLLPVDLDLQSKILADLSGLGLMSQPSTLGDLDQIVMQTKFAVAAYREQSPDVFSSGTDFISKALGFYFPKFRNIHGFSDQSIAAFNNFESLVQR